MQVCSQFSEVTSTINLLHMPLLKAHMAAQPLAINPIGSYMVAKSSLVGIRGIPIVSYPDYLWSGNETRALPALIRL